MFWNIGTNDYEKSSEYPDLAFLEKDEFNLLNVEEKIEYCYGVTKGHENEYTNKDIEVDDPFLLQKIEFLLKEWGIGSEIKNLYYGYIKKNFKEKWDSIIDAAKDNEHKKWELTFDIWDKKTDELGLHHWYLWEINEIYGNDSYYSVFMNVVKECSEDYEDKYKYRVKWKSEFKKKVEGIYNSLIIQNRSSWDDFIKKENISYPPPLSIQKKYPPDLTQDEQKAFEEYFQLIYWNKEIKTDKGRKKIFKYYPDVNF